jgi:hypothetical protein
MMNLLIYLIVSQTISILTIITIDYATLYAASLMSIGFLGMIGFGLSFGICYMKKKGINVKKLFKFQKLT